ncbi:hypothetical protein EST38_g13903 [Candolleomyces aberdarensis]|uniref:Uncharacterized protein n=1 Tax=Candolleomyces aberdarensis TaxID=2316362 RepID=A0A4Q2D128_9AGAR|nr:hypothetical protein EST38_g13903 [Candolleomyces aberdarensis]
MWNNQQLNQLNHGNGIPWQNLVQGQLVPPVPGQAPIVPPGGGANAGNAAAPNPAPQGLPLNPQQPPSQPQWARHPQQKPQGQNPTTRR